MMLIIEQNERISLNDYFSFFQNKKTKKEKYENEWIKFRKTFSCVSIKRNGKVEKYQIIKQEKN